MHVAQLPLNIELSYFEIGNFMCTSSCILVTVFSSRRERERIRKLKERQGNKDEKVQIHIEF